MKSFTNVLAIAATTLVSTVSAWDISWFESSDCSSSNSGWAFYTGTGQNEISMSSCLIPGQPGLPTEYCQWRTSTSADPQDCTAAMNPAAGSFYIPEGTNCFIGVKDVCGDDLFFGPDKVGQCIDVNSVQYYAGTLYFHCYDQN